MIVRTGRVYLDPEPPRGAHPGFRGELRVSELGVHVDEECEYLFIDLDEETDGWPMGKWELVEREQIIPWHRVFSIEWGEDFAVFDADGNRIEAKP